VYKLSSSLVHIIYMKYCHRFANTCLIEPIWTARYLGSSYIYMFNKQVSQINSTTVDAMLIAIQLLLFFSFSFLNKVKLLM